MQPYKSHASTPAEILVISARDAQKHNVSLCAEIGRASAISAWSTAASIVMQKLALFPPALMKSQKMGRGGDSLILVTEHLHASFVFLIFLSPFLLFSFFSPLL